MIFQGTLLDDHSHTVYRYCRSIEDDIAYSDDFSGLRCGIEAQNVQRDCHNGYSVISRVYDIDSPCLEGKILIMRECGGQQFFSRDFFQVSWGSVLIALVSTR